MSTFVDFMVQLFQIPAIIVGSIALIGLLVQRKPAGEVVTGTVKTALSLLIIGGGATILVNGLSPIQSMFEMAFPAGNVQTFVTFDEAVVSAVQTGPVTALGSEIGLTMLFGYMFHLLLARITPWHYVYLTGHMIWVHAGAFTIAIYQFGWSPWLTVLISSILVGFYYTLAPALAQPFVRRVTGGNDVGFAHGQTLLNVLAGYLGMVIGNKEKSTEETKLPEKLSFFRDVAVSTTIVMTIVSFVSASLAVATAGVSAFEAPADNGGISDGQNWIVFSLVMALTFTAGMLVLLYGVRMLIGEIVPAFEGISKKVIPDAIPALDAPVLFAFAPNALLVGLISGLIGQIAGMALCGAMGWPVPIPSMIVAFFASGTAAIFANSTGGRVAAWLGGFLWGFLGWILISFAYQAQVFGDLAGLGAEGLGFTVPDAIVPAIIIHFIGMLFGAA
ncbi:MULTISPECIES: PTS ascorbate transporter subunit IIC [Corynebacterium]|uniref:PTS ascorbate transporter subunit IIC n=1 Tax=Corynebacterium TaxID=1716 RepID=UPI00124F5FDD|nr:MULTISPECIES: PTS ascorbate transporter subunit IIC [Corynebacterium]